MTLNTTDGRAETDRTRVSIVILIVLITLLGLGLRLYGLDTQSLWYDEGFSAYLAGMDLGEITARTAEDIQPPLYYYLLHGWITLFGDSEQALRGLSVLFGVLSIPLLYAVAWRLFRSRLAGLLAALFVAVSPLHVWYGQEARMYTLLTFLCLLSSYLLLLVVDAEKRWQIALLWAAYTITSVVALYTHYFSFFILAFQAAYVLLVWITRRGRPLHLLLGGLISALVTVLCYLPWLPYLLTRYGVDASYWPGQLNMRQVLVDILISFVGGESVSDSIGTWLVIGYGLVFVLCTLALLADAARATRQATEESPSAMPASYYPILFLFLYLLLPPALILALSYASPKFNARYVMVSHPAFLLLLAGGLAVLWTSRSGYLGNVLRGALASLSLVFVLGVSVYADYNAYTDQDFARADFRGAVRYVRRHIEPDETVILTSGHMFPVFDYYARGMDRYLLPDSPTLDTTRTLDYSIASDLNGWLSDKDGVWLVLWQDEVVDPTGYLTAMLADAGEEQVVERDFPQVDVRHYRLSENAFLSDQPPIAHPADLLFGDRLRLLGYTQLDGRQVLLFWEATQSLDEDYRVSLVLRDTAGQSWGQWDGRPADYLYPTDRWRVGQVVFGRYDLLSMPGTPPGDYGLEVGVYTEDDPAGLDLLDPSGAPQGKRAMLGAVNLSVPAVEPDQIEVPNPARTELGDGLILLGWDLDRSEAQPGDRLHLTLVWSAESQPKGDDGARVLITDETGQVLDAGVYRPTNIWHPTSTWLPGQAWRGQTTFRLPIQTNPGMAQLAVQLVDATGEPLGERSDLMAFQVLTTTRVFAAPQPEASRQANFDNKIILLGADVGPDPVAPGGTLRMTLYWQALEEMDIPYSVFVHLLGSDGQMVTGQDGEPVFGTRPTTSWVPGEYITDPHDLTVPADLALGEYVIEVGLYDAGAPRMPRLPVVGEEGEGETDRVIFGPISVR